MILVGLTALASVHACCLPSLAFPSEIDPKEVLVLHSYHVGLNWTDNVTLGIRDVFSDQPAPPQLYVEYMDSKRNPSAEFLSGVLNDFLTRKFKGKRFELLLLSDSDALEFVRRHRNDLFAGVPIVFCGINNFTPSLLEGMGAVTGVAELPEIEKTVDLALELHPGTEEIIFIGRTDMASDRANDEMYGSAAKAYEGRVAVTFWNDLPVEELQARLRRLRPGRLVFSGTTLNTAAGRVLTFAESARRLREASRVPIYSFWDTYFGEGIVGGKLINGRSHGRHAAELAVRILSGENPEGIAVVTSESNPYMFDYRELERFGIPLKALPKGSLVDYRPPPFYEISERQLWAALLSMAGLSLALFVAMIGRMRAVQALQISEERFRRVINSSPMGIHQYQCTRDGRLVLAVANPAADTIFDLDNQVFIGKTLEEAFPMLAETEVPARFREVCSKGSLWHTEEMAYEDQNIKGIFELYAFPTGPGMMACMFRDITERKRAQDQVRESRQMLQLILDYIPQHVFWKDRDSVYLGCNRNFARAAGGESSREIIGKTDYELAWKKEEADFYRECDRRVMESDAPELHIIEPQLQASGKQAWVDTNKIPLHNGEGRVVGILGTFEDITDRKQAEEALKEANRELDAFVYTVAHDLRSPLTPIIGYADFLLENYRESLDEQARECLTEISTSGARMMALMEDLLTLARVGQLERPEEPVDTGEVVNEVLRDLDERLSRTGVVVEAGDLPALHVPRTLLTQLFDNLIGNAVRYAGSEGSPVEIGGERRGILVRFHVRDHGPGIPEEERSRIFEAFFRGATGNGTPGTGVGLATVQKIARIYGGRAWVEETEGGGSTFRVEMVDDPDAAEKAG